MCARQSERARPGQGLIALATPLSRKVTMTSKTQKAIAALDSMRLPELQARYLEVIGTATRCPNRAYPIRKLSEALTLNGKASSRGSFRSHKPKPVRADDEGGIGETHDSVVELIDNAQVADADAHPADDTDVLPIGVPQEESVGAGSASIEMASDEPLAGDGETHVRGRYRGMTIEELQQKYLDVIGRKTSSSHKGYLVWKIREAERGRVRVGSAKERRVAGTAVDVKVLPLRLEAPTLMRIDSAWRTQGLRSRMEFFRRAVEHYLEVLGGTH